MALYLCLDCGTVYDSKFFNPRKDGSNAYYCPRRNCGGDLIELDELMIYPIKVLNQKGYITEFCCSGHIDGSQPYIAFNENYNEYIGAPEGWTWDTDNIDRGISCIRYKDRASDEEDVYNNLDIMYNATKSLYKWVDEIRSMDDIKYSKDLKNNLNNRICDCEEGSVNEQTYLEFIIEGYKEIGCPLSDNAIDYLTNDATNKELIDTLEEIDYLLEK